MASKNGGGAGAALLAVLVIVGIGWLLTTEDPGASIEAFATSAKAFFIGNIGSLKGGDR